MEHRGNFSSLWLFNSLWMAKHRPRTSSASCERSVVLYSTSTANKCFIALFTQWNLFHYFYKKANCPSQITALMKHNQSQRCSHRGATERNSCECPVGFGLNDMISNEELLETIKRQIYVYEIWELYWQEICSNVHMSSALMLFNCTWIMNQSVCL